MSSESQKFLLAMVAPTLITLLGFMLSIKPMITGGLVFMGLTVCARWMRRHS